MKKKRSVYAATVFILLVAGALVTFVFIKNNQKCEVIQNRNTCAYKNNRCTDPDGPMARYESTIDCKELKYYDPAKDPENK